MNVKICKLCGCLESRGLLKWEQAIYPLHSRVIQCCYLYYNYGDIKIGDMKIGHKLGIVSKDDYKELCRVSENCPYILEQMVTEGDKNELEILQTL